MDKEPNYELPTSIPFNPNEEKWRLRANCKGLDTDIFFPTRGATKQKIAEAKAICAQCTVQEECHQYAMSYGERRLIGIWGGKTAKQRRKERRT